MNNRFLLVLVACVLGFFGILFFTKKDNSTNTNSSSTAQATNHTYGEGKSGVVLIEYGDFECPACYRFYPVIEEVKEKYKDQITFQFRHFPLVQIHQNALLASRAAEAAAVQGKFWEMYSALYTNQQSWASVSDPTDIFVSYAQQIGLDANKFKSDMVSEEINAIVQKDISIGKEKGFNSTPTFELDGKKLEDVRDTVEYFSEQIDKAIAEKSKN